MKTNISKSWFKRKQIPIQRETASPEAGTQYNCYYSPSEINEVIGHLSGGVESLSNGLKVYPEH